MISAKGNAASSSAHAELRMPLYLDTDVQKYLAERAAQQGIPLGETVNGLLKEKMRISKSVD